MKRIAVLSLVLISGAVHAAPFCVWDGRNAATIVYANDARDEAVTAYKDLARCLGSATGAEFAVVSEDRLDSAADLQRIYVGQCAALSEADRAELATLDRDAYLVNITEDGTAFLVGPRPWSTYWAVCQFLEDYANVRWLIPGPLGEDIPRHSHIFAQPYRRVFSPALLSRLWSGAQYGGPWSLRQRIHGRYRFHHNLIRVFDADKYYDDHPEWFPLRRNGKRYRPQGGADHSWQPCLASASSVKHAADTARAAWAKNPDLESFSYGCNDGQGWCECDGCKAMDKPIEPWEGFEGTYSYRYYTWLNRVAVELEKTHPNNLIGCLAYSSYILPPEKEGLHRNVIPYFTSNRADYFEPEFRGQDQKLLEWWGRVAKQMGIYDYAYGMGFAVPRIYNHLFQGAIQHAVANGVKGFYAEVYPNWGLDGPKLYVMSRVLWDPTIDIDAVSENWNRRMFREAWQPMSAYFARCEKAWREQKTGRGHWAYRLAADPKQFDVFPPSVLKECTGYLDQAAKGARTDIVRDRIHFFRKTWEVTVLLAGNYWAGQEVQELIEDDASLKEIAGALRRMADKVATIDVDGYIKERVGKDPMAYFPPKPSWIGPLKAGSSANAMRVSASRLSERVVKEALGKGDVSAEGLRRVIGERLDTAFGMEGSDTYLEYVQRLRKMAQKVAKAVRTSTAPVIDGVLSDAVWKDADVLTDFIRWGQTTPSAYPTRAKLAHDGTNLYVALECFQDTSALHCDAADRDGSTWKDDSIEMFINPGLEEFPYIQFIINAKGAFFDLWGKADDESYQERVSVNFDCRWAAKVAPDRWTAEMVVPLADFGCKPARNSLLRFNFARNVQGKEAEISAWFLSVKAHADPRSRGWVVFE
ncbi:MAG: DUF4838 domain-containing protein [Lentisphaerae bacterium]|jgi:hypothetical protein|nr:DUF4838 domain-containing protein [Lentisphaerota bacterium]MBT4822644.1 DUF4838 domain-containing protein [Lentisphaerota bacterium]MBT5608740.1 DUF4838 domain-containing protein [Lentisphaerota bacterium]MBT7054099.1 DUF4838 domain-containing protein [Lentisphaerota bacterium]MBT7845138.1 DUF4838 domain-containing protein [Lentisphaerota bacterium]